MKYSVIADLNIEAIKKRIQFEECIDRIKTDYDKAAKERIKYSDFRALCGIDFELRRLIKETLIESNAAEAKEFPREWLVTTNAGADIFCCRGEHEKYKESFGWLPQHVHSLLGDKEYERILRYRGEFLNNIEASSSRRQAEQWQANCKVNNALLEEVQKVVFEKISTKIQEESSAESGIHKISVKDVITRKQILEQVKYTVERKAESSFRERFLSELRLKTRDKAKVLDYEHDSGIWVDSPVKYSVNSTPNSILSSLFGSLFNTPVATPAATPVRTPYQRTPATSTDGKPSFSSLIPVPVNLKTAARSKT